ncbi:MAG: hypothetical protein IJR66_02130 [Clostridia bacterium]|nr:hypothetical protein [Clostridia bacterium]
MKRISISVLSIILCLIYAFSFTFLFACKKEEPKDDTHTHLYLKTEVEATCQSQGYTIYRCSVCGKTFKGDYNGPVDHTIGGDTCLWCSVNYFKSFTDWIIENYTRKTEIKEENFKGDYSLLTGNDKYYFYYDLQRGDKEANVKSALIRYTPYTGKIDLAIRFQHEIEDKYQGEVFITVIRIQHFLVEYYWQITLQTQETNGENIAGADFEDENFVGLIGHLNGNFFSRDLPKIDVDKYSDDFYAETFEVQNHIARSAINNMDELIVIFRNFLIEKQIEIEGYEGHYLSLKHFNLNKIEERESAIKTDVSGEE